MRRRRIEEEVEFGVAPRVVDTHRRVLRIGPNREYNPTGKLTQEADQGTDLRRLGRSSARIPGSGPGCPLRRKCCRQFPAHAGPGGRRNGLDRMRGPNSALAPEHHVFVEASGTANSVIAFANSGDQELNITAVLLGDDGIKANEATINLGAGTQLARFINEIFEDIDTDFKGSLHLYSDDLLAMIGLRQRPSGSLAVLSGAATTLPAGKKDDPEDASLLLELVYRHRDRLRRWRPEAAQTRQLGLLVEGRRQWVEQRKGLVQQLGQALKSYYPQPLECFEDLGWAPSPGVFKPLAHLGASSECADRCAASLLCTSSSTLCRAEGASFTGAGPGQLPADPGRGSHGGRFTENGGSGRAADGSAAGDQTLRQAHRQALR